ncbi:MAG: condensation domain-containing protein, partial [Blastocatellia bacterium]
MIEVRSDDDFFSLGGDSILSMQICSRAAGFGLKLTPGQVMRERFLANVAAIAADEEAPVTGRGPVTGDLPLTPIQHWFFELGLDEPDTYNQSVFFESAHALDPEAVRVVCSEIISHHDALRLRFMSRDGRIQQMNEKPSDIVPFVKADLQAVSGTDVLRDIGGFADEIFHSISLERGLLVRVVLFHRGDEPGQWLLFVIHHLAVDGVSWRVLLEDFWIAYDQAERGVPIQLSPRTTSFKEWAHRLGDYASSEQAIAQKEYWLSQISAASPTLPIDIPEGSAVKERPQTIGFELPPDETRVLLTLVRDGVQAALAAALVESLVPWILRPAILVDMEAHGREALFEEVDLSRTVGWFTATYPVHLSTEGQTSWTGRIRQVAEQLARVPDGGIGYGALKYLSGIVSPPFADENQKSASPNGSASERIESPTRRALRPRRFLPEVSLNYLGQFDQSLKKAEKHAIPAEWAGPKLTTAKLAHLIEVNG